MNNKLIEELYKTIEAKDNIINNQALEIARLNDELKEIKNNRNDITKDEVYMDMRKETLVKTINLKRDTISYLASERRKLQQENKQLKEDFVVLKKLQMISNDILNELEEWLKDEYKKYSDNFISNIVDEEYSYFDSNLTDFDRTATIIDIVKKMDKETLDKIQELKEKYK